MKTSFSNDKNSLRFWWIFLFSGGLLLTLGLSVLMRPKIMFSAFSLYFALAFIINGLIEVFFSFRNQKVIRGWKWYLAGGALDLLISSIFIANPILSAAALPLLVGLWLLFRSLAVIGRAFELKQWGMMHWEYLLFFGIAGFVFSWINISSPLFATTVTVTWTGIALLTAGIFYLYFSLLIKTSIRKIHSHKISSL
jgi:uncharacterized membrane protein HdeD (DUF308 family)